MKGATSTTRLIADYWFKCLSHSRRQEPSLRILSETFAVRSGMAFLEHNTRLHELLTELTSLLRVSLVPNGQSPNGQDSSSNVHLQGGAVAALHVAQQLHTTARLEGQQQVATGSVKNAAAAGSPAQITSQHCLPASTDHSIQQQQRQPDLQQQPQQVQQAEHHDQEVNEQTRGSDRPKPLVQLEMPHGEVLAGQHAPPLQQQRACGKSTQQQSAAVQMSVNAAVQEQQLQYNAHQHTCFESSSQQRPIVPPLVLATKLFKPSISDVVMQMRAANQVQGKNSSAGSGAGPAGSQGSPVLAAAAAANMDATASGEWPDSPVVASVHLVHNRCEKQQLEKQQVAWEQTGTAAYTAQQIGFDFGGCKDINLLAKRVSPHGQCSHSSSNNLQQLGVVDLACLSTMRSIGMLIKVVLWDILLPNRSFMLGWNILMMALILYLAVVLPFGLAFAIDFSDLRYPLAAFDLCINLLFMLDVTMNFRMAIIGDDGRLILDRKEIAVAYLKGWFIFDVLSSIPYEQIINNHNSLPSMLMLIKVPSIGRISKVLKLLRLLRLANVKWLPHVMLSLEALLGRVVLQLVMLAGSMLLLLHWAACIWYFVASLEAGTENWLVYNHMVQANDVEKYITALYWSVTTIATVGYGDIVGHNITEKIIAMIAMLIGAFVFGYFMGAMTVMVSALNANSARMATKRQSVDSFLKHRKVPKLLADKVRSYYNYVVEREVQADEADIIIGLSASLRTQVVLHLYQEALEKVPFFRGQHPQFITSVVTFLKLEYYSPGDIVVRQGDVGAEMYFVGEGLLEVRLYEDDQGTPLIKATYKRTAAKEAHKGSRASTPAHDKRHDGSFTQQACCSTEQAGADQHAAGSATHNIMRKCRCAVDAAAAAVKCLAGRVSSSNEHQRTEGGFDQKSIEAGGSENSSQGGAVTSATGRHQPAGSHRHREAALPEEFQLPFCSKRTIDKYTYVDELGDRPYRTIGFLRPGEYFGEFSCLLGEARTATVVASSHCELYSLSRGDLEEVLQQWPELAEEFEAMVEIAADRRMAQSPTLGQPSGPLTKWNVFKAAYQQGVFENCTPAVKLQPQRPETLLQQQQQQHVSSAGPAGPGNSAVAGAVPAELRRESFDAASRSLQPLRRSSATPRTLRDLGVSASESHPSLGRRLVERTRSCAVERASASGAVDEVNGMRRRNRLFLSQQGQVQQQAGRAQQQQQQEEPAGVDSAAAAAVAAGSCAPAAEDARESNDLVADEFLCGSIARLPAGSTVLPPGQQVHRQVSSLTRQSMPCPPLARTSSGLARSSQGLLRNTPSFTRRCSGPNSGGGVLPELRRTSWMLSGQGTRGGGGGYLFSMPIDRHGSLMVPAVDAFAVAEDFEEA